MKTSLAPNLEERSAATTGGRTMFTKTRTTLAILIVMALLLAACGGTAAPAPEAATSAPADSAQPAAPSAPVQARIGWGGSPDSLNPGAALLTEAYTLFELVYSSMFDLNLDGTYSLDLAKSWDVSDDGLVHTFTLRDDFTWHDGQPVTAKDVAFTYNFYGSHEDFPYMPVYTEYFESVEAPDDQTVVITLSEPIPNMESQLVFMYILPEHIWAEHDTPEGATAFENEQMIGSGPFKLKEYRQNEYVTLDAVKDHPLTPPKIDGIVFQTFDNQDALVQALVSGQVDMITEMPNTAVPALRNAENLSLIHI